MKRYRLDEEVLVLLETSGLEWEVRHKRKHHALLIQGRMVAVIPHSPRDCGCHKDNLRSCVRRSIRQMRGEV